MNKILFTILALSLPLGLFAKEKLTLATLLIPHYVESNSSGAFVELAKKLAEISGYELEIKVYPPKRAFQKFAEGSVDGYFPALDRLNPKDISKTSDFYIKEDFIFERTDSDYKKIKSPKVCLTTGYAYSKEISENKDWKFIYSKSDKKCLERLMIDRVQLFIGEDVSALSTIKAMKLTEKIKYNKFRPISSQGVYFAFSDSKRGKEIGHKFDQALKKFVMDGGYDLLFPEKKR